MYYAKLVFGAMALSLLVGCAGPQKENEPDPIGSIPTPTGPTTTVMPLAAYVPGDKALRVIRKAEGLLLNACTAEYGLKTDVDAPSYEAKLDDVRKGTKLPLTREHVQRYGYHPAQSPARARSDEREEESAAETADKSAKMLVVNGPVTSGTTPLSPSLATKDVKVNGKPVPEGGCLRLAEEKLADGAPDLNAVGAHGRSAFNVILALRYQASRQSAEHSAYTRMVTRWSACMKRAGFSYPDFASAMGDPEWGRSRRATDREIAVATADVRCRLDVNYLGVTEALQIAYEKNAVKDNAELLQAVKKYYQVMLRNAKKRI
ncbi:hypothetical protein ACIPSA_21530 [Streptomyces sp. NPDC086549]|uniref:hypothetical protein n=1 Tax=Streptomyces sp. NPDC086549 TaxID=3365752 RepID=UPI0038147290